MTDEHATNGSSAHERRGAAAEFDRSVDRLRGEFHEMTAALGRSLHVQRQVLGLTLFDLALRGTAWVAALAAALTAAVYAVLLAVGSVRRAVAAWTGAAWWADLVLAGALVAVLVACGWLVRRRVHSAAFARTRRRLAAMTAEDPRAREPERAHPETTP